MASTPNHSHNHNKCCLIKQKLRRGLWSPEEDERLMDHIKNHGPCSWSSVPQLAGLQRCGKSCRLRWINYLRPNLKRGSFTPAEERRIIELHGILGNKWSKIASFFPGRTDNEIKNLWNSSLKKRVDMKTAGASTSTSKDQDQLPTINTETERIKANQSSSITNHQSRMVINFPFSLQPLNDPPYPLLNHPNPNNIIHDNPKLVNHHPIVDRAPVNHTFIVPANHTLSSSTSSHESTASKQPLATANHPLPFSDHILTPANQSLTTANNPLSTTAVGNGNNQYAIVDYNHTNVHDHKDNDQKPASGICGECDIAYANHPTVQKSMQGDTAMVISYDDEDEYDHDYEDDDDDDDNALQGSKQDPHRQHDKYDRFAMGNESGGSFMTWVYVNQSKLNLIKELNHQREQLNPLRELANHPSSLDTLLGGIEEYSPLTMTSTGNGHYDDVVVNGLVMHHSTGACHVVRTPATTAHGQSPTSTCHVAAAGALAPDTSSLPSFSCEDDVNLWFGEEVGVTSLVDIEYQLDSCGPFHTP